MSDRPPAAPPPEKSVSHPIPDQLRAAIVTQTQYAVHESRPMPSPKEMAEYNAIIPGAAERFMAAWETESAHRREMERMQIAAAKEELTAAAADRRLGIALGFILGLCGLAGLIYAALNDVSFTGLAPIVVALGALVWAVRRSTGGERELPPERDPERNPDSRL